LSVTPKEGERESLINPVFAMVYPEGHWNWMTIGSMAALEPTLTITLLIGGEGWLMKLVDMRNVPRRMDSMEDHHVATSISARGK
jgi:hypothetical protein